MKIIFPQNEFQRRRQRGLTLVEMMVATTLLVVMMLGLTAMFNQTQRAFRSGLKQVDVFEGGRAVMDLVTRDIEQAIASKSIDNWSFYSTLPPNSISLNQKTPAGTGDLRTNLLYETFFYNYSTLWSAIGYRVLAPNDVDAKGLVYGSLYRFATNFSEFNVNVPNEHLYNTFFKDPSTLTNQSLTRVADGIVHFRLRFYDATGKLVPLPDADGNIYYPVTNLPPDVRAEIFINNFPNEPRVIFSNTLPSMVEVELGILDPQTLQQAQAMPTPATQTAYLEKQAGKVHIFRQQIQIRNAPR